jgi:chromosome partitioning protein
LRLAACPTAAPHGPLFRTTSVANLGVAFAQLGLRTLLIDADPQGNLGEAFGVEPDQPGARLQDGLTEPGGGQVTPWVARANGDGSPVALAGGVHLLPGGDQLEEAVSARTAEPDFPLPVNVRPVHA